MVIIRAVQRAQVEPAKAQKRLPGLPVLGMSWSKLHACRIGRTSFGQANLGSLGGRQPRRVRLAAGPGLQARDRCRGFRQSGRFDPRRYTCPGSSPSARRSPSCFSTLRARSRCCAHLLSDRIASAVQNCACSRRLIWPKIASISPIAARMEGARRRVARPVWMTASSPSAISSAMTTLVPAAAIAASGSAATQRRAQMSCSCCHRSSSSSSIH